MSRLRRRAGPALLAATIALVAACSDDDAGSDDGDGTLGPVANGSGTVAAATVDGSIESPTDATTMTTGDVGDGFVSLQVRVAATGVDEVIALDRATVATDQFDPRSLDATCTSLDGGDAWTVSVTDLRRMSAGNRLISAALRVEGPVDAAGEYPATLEVGDNQQVITAYTGNVTIADGLASGSFDVVDPSGGVATGSFVCGAEPAVATTVPATVPATAGTDEVSGSDLPVPTVPAVTAPPLTAPPLTVPPLTVPIATS